MADKLLGRNPVLEAMRAGRKIFRLYMLEGGKKGKIEEIVQFATAKHIPIDHLSRHELDQMAGNSNHQGVIAEVEPILTGDIEDLIGEAERRGESPFLLLLDEIQDPHNLGSLLRSADAAGVHGVVIPKHRSVGLTETVAKTSAGAVEYVMVAKVTNMAQAIDRLKEKGIWVAGADMEGEQECYTANLTGPIALVIGSEGKGLSRLTKDKCDYLVRLPMYGEVNSLNASVAGALLMYEVRRQRNLQTDN